MGFSSGRRRGRPPFPPGAWGPPGPFAGPHGDNGLDDDDDAGFGMGFGPGHGRGRFGPGRGRGGPGGRRRRGDVRALLLAALLDGDAHGYELIRRLEERAAGAWRPSAGSVYPTLQLLEEEELVAGRDETGKRIFALTDAGRSEAERARDGGAWDQLRAGTDQRDLGRSLAQLALAVKQVTIAGDSEQIGRAATIIAEARQSLYRLLAGD